MGQKEEAEAIREAGMKIIGVLKEFDQYTAIGALAAIISILIETHSINKYQSYAVIIETLQEYQRLSEKP